MVLLIKQEEGDTSSASAVKTLSEMLDSLDKLIRTLLYLKHESLTQFQTTKPTAEGS